MPDRVICYDIADPARLGRVHRAMARHAAAIEYSMFLLPEHGEPIDLWIDEVVALIDPREDDLRVYSLPARGRLLRIGRAVLPAGIHWSALPAGQGNDGW